MCLVSLVTPSRLLVWTCLVWTGPAAVGKLIFACFSWASYIVQLVVSAQPTNLTDWTFLLPTSITYAHALMQRNNGAQRKDLKGMSLLAGVS